MKKFLIVLIMLGFVSLAFGLTYDADNYKKNLSYVRTGTYNDPILRFMTEVETLLFPSSGTGTIWYVDSTVVTEGAGTSWTAAFDTIEEAYDECAANNGDIVYVAAGHQETLGTLVLDTEGVTLRGFGRGEDIPEIRYNGTGDIVTISAASNVLYNLSFLASVHAVTTAINITADGDYTSIISCEFPEPNTNTYDFATAIQLTGAADNVTVANCVYKHADAIGPVEFIDGGTSAVQGLTVVGNRIHSEFSAAAIFSDQTDTEMYIAYNTISNMTSSLYAIDLGDNATGWLVGNKVSTDAIGTSVDPGKLSVDETTVWSAYGTADVTAVPIFTNMTGVLRWGATELAQLEGEAVDAIEADSLDKLISADDSAGATAYPDSVVDDSILAYIMTSDQDHTGYDNTSMSLEALNVDLDAIIVDAALWNTSTKARTILYGADTPGAVASAQTTAQTDLDLLTDSDGVIIGAAALALIQAEVTTALEADFLDHLVAAAIGDDPVDGSIIADLASKLATSDWTTYNNQTDSQEAIRDAIDGLTGVGFRGTVSAGSTVTSVVCNDLAGFGNDYFNTNWSLYVVKDLAGSAAAPEGVRVDITDYATLTGTFTVLTTGTACATGDEIYILRNDEMNLDDATILGASGNIWYVDSGASTGDSTGTTWENAFDTILLAIAGATASNGDVIYIAAGHSEDVAGAYAINKAGLSFVGKGEGDLQATMVFSATGSQLDVTVADVMMENIKFEASIPDVVAGIDVADGGDGFYLKRCRFVDDTATTDEFLIAINLQADADDVVIERCEFLTVGGGATEGIFIGEVVDNLQIIGNYMVGDWTVSAIWGDEAITNALIKDNVIFQETNSQHAIELDVGSLATGMLIGNFLYTDSYSTMLDPGSMICIGNEGTIALDESPMAIPISVDSAAVAAQADGSNLERLEYLQVDTAAIIVDFTNSGSYLIIQADVLSSAILNNTQSGSSAITGAASGTLLLIDIYISLDSTGWNHDTPPTNFEISCDNVKGLTGADAPIVLEVSGSFGANTTFQASVDGDTKLVPFVLESGKKLYFHGDDDTGTGGGTGTITMVFQRVSDAATIAGNDLS